MNKIKVLIFEGQDGVGKSTLIAEINKKTKYKYICIDRFLGSAFTYKRHDTKKIEIAELSLAINTKLDFYLIHLICEDNKTLTKRLGLKKDEDKIINIEKHRQIYDNYFENSPLKKIQIDTKDNNIKDCIKMILELTNDN